MNKVFVDTSGWASFFIKTDLHHEKAFELMMLWQQQNRRVVTTNYVLSELVALFTRFHVRRVKALDYINGICSDTLVEVIHVDPPLDKEAWKLLENRLDKVWSLVDAASFVVMKNRRITEALTTDHHFEQAGFTRLLK